MNVYERQARALENIARELKGIGQSLKRIEEKTIPPFRDRDPLAEAKAALFNGEVQPEDCAAFDDNIVFPLVDTKTYEAAKKWAFGATDLPRIACTPGTFDPRQTEDGGNG